MKLSNPIEKNGILEEVLRICNCTNSVYSNYAMIANLNDALDKYWFLAAQSASQGTFDDENNTAIPVETQSLVDGTNAYKMSSFTNNVLQILRVSILDDDADEYDLVYQDFEDIDNFTQEWSTDSDKRGIPQYWTKLGDYIYIYPCPNYSETNGLRVYVNRELSKFNWVSVVGNVDDTLTTTSAHGLSALDAVIFETDGTIITPITADTVVYYVITDGLTTTKFKISTSYSATGTAVNITDAQAGSNHKYTEVSKEPGIPLIHHKYLARYAANEFMDSKHPKFAKNRELMILDERNIQEYWQSMIRPAKTIIEPDQRCYK